MKRTDGVEENQFLLVDYLGVELPGAERPGQIAHEGLRAADFRERPAVFDEDTLELSEQSAVHRSWSALVVCRTRGFQQEIVAHRLHRSPHVRGKDASSPPRTYPEPRAAASTPAD